MEQLSECERYWLAGLMEGEGSFSVPRKGGNAPRMYFGSADLDIVEKVSSMWNVRYYERSVREGHKRFYQLVMQSRQVVAWMEWLRPLMGVRRQEQIDTALAATPYSRDDADCKWCGDPIPIGTRGRRTYCTHACANKGNAQRKREYMAVYRQRVAV